MLQSTPVKLLHRARAFILGTVTWRFYRERTLQYHYYCATVSAVRLHSDSIATERAT